MRQSSAKNVSTGQKREPIAHAIDPAGVSQIGSAMGNHATGGTKILHGASKPLYAGRGFEAPMAGCDQHHSGSQGKHK
jgi:hypothetical protein